MASVQFNESEDYMSNTLYEGYLSTFVQRDLGKKLHMSFDDFISRPRYEIQMMLKVIKDADEKRSKVSDEILKSLEQQTPKPDKN